MVPVDWPAHNLIMSESRVGYPVKILVADDHSIIRRLVTSSLKAEPHFDVIAEAENGLEAVQKASELKPDVVVLNISMPVLDGFEAARRIRQQLPKVTIVILSNNADKRFIEEAKRVGARAYVPKSKGAIALVEAIQVAMRNDEFYVVE
jgi:DNA-binding NarL/FixJ family response regulator